MSAISIATALGDARREGRGWRCRCPLHGGRSLTLRDGEGGRLLVTCWAGCDRLDVLDELRRRGWLNGCMKYRAPINACPLRDDAAHAEARITHARALWHEARPIVGTIAERYLRSRAIKLNTWPEALRFHPRCPHPAGEKLPAMVALIGHIERGFVGLHRTFLCADGERANLTPTKATLGPTSGGAVRLREPGQGEWLALAEGVETALSIMSMTELPTWATLGTSGLRNVMLASETTLVLIAADNDANGAGQLAALEAGRRFLSEGRRIRVATPPVLDTDWNDVLAGRLSSEIRGASRVA